MVSNGSYHYDHDRDGTHTELDGCEAKFRQAKHDTFIAIRYERNRLMVSWQVSTLAEAEIKVSMLSRLCIQWLTVKVL